MNFNETIQAQKPILTEGAMVERVRRHPDVALDPEIAHAGLIYSDRGRNVLAGIYRQYLSIGSRHDLPMLTLAPTWRANPERIAKAGSNHKVETLNRDCVNFLKEIQDEFGDYGKKIFVAGMLGCRGDAYNPQEALGEKDAVHFHGQQVAALAASGADFIKAATLPAVSEALGIARAISNTGLPAVISFVIRPDGTLLDGTPLHTAVEMIDAAVNPAPAFYMVNCVHPVVFMSAMGLETALSETVARRVLGFQANTSAKSPEELDNLNYLDTTEPDLFAKMMLEIHHTFGTRVLGGCCGTDDRHIEKIAEQLVNI
jgi:homocysteine S-methyltransferase